MLAVKRIHYQGSSKVKYLSLISGFIQSNPQNDWLYTQPVEEDSNQRAFSINNGAAAHYIADCNRPFKPQR